MAPHHSCMHHHPCKTTAEHTHHTVSQNSSRRHKTKGHVRRRDGDRMKTTSRLKIEWKYYDSSISMVLLLGIMLISVIPPCLLSSCFFFFSLPLCSLPLSPFCLSRVTLLLVYHVMCYSCLLSLSPCSAVCILLLLTDELVNVCRSLADRQTMDRAHCRA